MPDSPTVLQRVATKVLQRYWRLSRGLHLGVRALLLDEQVRVLLIRDSNGGDWHLPGGEVAGNEPVATALARHLSREPGIKVEATPELICLCSGLGAGHCDHVALLAVGQWNWNHARGQSEAEFFPPDTLPEDTSSGTIKIIADYNRISRRPSPSGQ